MTQQVSDLDRVIDLCRHERPEVAQRALDVLRAECDRLRDAGEYADFEAFVFYVWRRDVWAALLIGSERIIVVDDGENV